MPPRPLESLGLQPQDPPEPSGHYFFFNYALAGILILMVHIIMVQLYQYPVNVFICPCLQCLLLNVTRERNATRTPDTTVVMDVGPRERNME